MERYRAVLGALDSDGPQVVGTSIRNRGAYRQNIYLLYEIRYHFWLLFINITVYVVYIWTLPVLQGLCELLQQSRLFQAQWPQADKLSVKLCICFLHLQSSGICTKYHRRVFTKLQAPRVMESALMVQYIYVCYNRAEIKSMWGWSFPLIYSLWNHLYFSRAQASQTHWCLLDTGLRLWIICILQMLPYQSN